ncbi:MAG: hypothetical protein CL878_02525 [Dehalococcoidia bacterium]|nr:hypothetical protein [Dehalococcoidia bacterium]
MMQPLPDDERLVPPEARSAPWRERLPPWGGGLVLLAIMVAFLGMIERTGVGLWFTGVLTGLVIFASMAVWVLLMLLGLSSRVRLVGAGIIFVIGFLGLVAAGLAGFLTRP